MQEFFLGVAGTLIGAGTAALIGYLFWKRQRIHEARLQLLRETCADFAQLSRIASGAEDEDGVEHCILRLQSNLALTEIFYGKAVAALFLDSMKAVAGAGLAPKHRDAPGELLATMVKQLR